MKLLQNFKELTVRPKNAQELKGLILKLAVQGKLTANWRAEHTDVEPASELLKKIKKVKAKGNYELSEKEIPFDLPSTWVWSLLGKLCSVQTGKKDANYGTDNGQYNFYTCAQKPIKSPTYTFEGESIILPGNGANVGLVTFVNEKFEAYQRTYVLNKFNHLYPLYIKTALEALWKDNLGRQYGSAINYIKMGNITEFKFPIPPLEEQKEIVKVVETLFKEVEQLEQLTVARIGLKEDFVTSALKQLTNNNANQEWTFLQAHFKSFFNETTNIKKLRETVLQLAVQGKLTQDWRSRHPELVEGQHHASQLLKRIQEEKAQLIADKKIKKEKALPVIAKEDIPYELPDGWVWCRLQDLVNVGTGSTPAKSNSSYYDGTIPWYTSSATNDLYAKESEKLITEKALQETNCKVFPKGTLIIAMYGQGKTRGQISELVIPGATNQAVAAMVFYETSKDFKEYIKYFFRRIYDEIRLLAEGGAQPNLNVGKIKNTILPLPPLEEQKAIVEKVNALMGLCDALEQEVQQGQKHSEQLMQSVLREVFEVERKTVVG